MIKWLFRFKRNNHFIFEACLAFPASWNVDFKLHAFDNTTVRVISKGTAVSQMQVFPIERRKDIMYKEDLDKRSK